MTLEDVKRYVFLFFRVLVFTLAFTTDVKVRADIVMQSVQGDVEVEINRSETLNRKEVLARSSFVEPLGVETFKNSSVKMTANSVYLGFDSNTFVEFEKEPVFKLYWGKVLVKLAHNILIKTPSGDVKSERGEFFVSVVSGKTKVTVISGEVSLFDRSSTETLRLMAGTTGWVGGLLVIGRRDKSSVGVLSFESTMEQLKQMGPYSAEELQGKYDTFLPIWKFAVKSVAEGYQKEISRDIASYSKYRQKVEAQKREDTLEQQTIKKLFRQKTLGL
jgi:hypothetical protein